ncbi:MAG: TonB-dependent receptor [Proteobacteria bacterium]|nr:TonB-dependent receptor [Pseudomonadota bacterium]MDA0993320.1 TonB-dependent receptor [Pseudomonadota bacterium]
MRGSNPTTINVSRQCLATTLATIAISVLPFTGSTVLAQGLQLEEIIVTAQRRAENMQDVPISVTQTSGERLTSMFEGGETILAMANRLPALYVESSNGRLAPRFYMRGLGNTDFDLAASQSVSVIFDEVVQENVILKSFPIFDVAGVEVLRGPQGSLFGRNTTAGIVKFDSRKPSEDFNAYALASVGSLGTLNFEGALGGALNDAGTLMGRFSVLSQNRDDWIDNSFAGTTDALGGFNELAWRGQLLLEPSEDLTVLLNVHGRDFDGTASIFRANVLNAGSNAFNTNYDRDVVQFDEGNNNPQEAEAYGGSLKVDLEFGNGVTLTSITGVETVSNRSEGDIDGGFGAVFLPFMGPGFIPFPSHSADGLEDLEQFTQEIRLSGEGNDGFLWQGGFYFFDSSFTVFTNPFFVSESKLTHENTAWALFGQVSLPLSDRLTLIGGLRYTDDEKDMAATNPPLPTPAVSADGEQTSFDLSLLFNVNDDVNFYARVANGFRAPSIQGRDVAFFGGTSTADAETIMSYEAGFKMTLVDNLMRLNGAVYHYVIDDMQMTAIGGGGNFVQLINAEEGTGTGMDLDLELLISENFLVTAGFSIADTEIKDSSLTVPPCGSGACSTTDPLDINGNAILNGNPFPGAPDHTINFTARYSVPTDSGEVFFFTDWARQGKTNFFLYETAEFFSSGNYEGGLRAGYIHGDNDWELSIFGRNITDEENLKGAIDFNNLTGFDNEPRIWGITFRKNWSD